MHTHPRPAREATRNSGDSGPASAGLGAACKRRLSPSDAATLHYVFCELEAEVGLRSLHGAQVDAIMGLRGTGSRLYLSPVETWACWSRQGQRRAGQRAYHVLTHMAETCEGSKCVTVLYRVYGPRDPNARYDLLGDLAPLAEYTPTVEHALRRGGYVDTGEAFQRRLCVHAQALPGEAKAVFARRQMQLRSERVQFIEAVRNDAEELLHRAANEYFHMLHPIST